MSAKGIMAIAIKLMAIFLMVGVVLNAPRLILTISTMERMYENEFHPIFYISVVGFFILIGVVSAFVLYKVSNSVLSSIPEPDQSEPIYASEKFILQVFGVYFIVSALQTFPSLAIAYSSSSNELVNHLGHFIGYTFELLVGLWLLISPKAWLNIFNKLRGRA